MLNQLFEYINNDKDSQSGVLIHRADPSKGSDFSFQQSVQSAMFSMQMLRLHLKDVKTLDLITIQTLRALSFHMYGENFYKAKKQSPGVPQ
jgi:hypothetical protein